MTTPTEPQSPQDEKPAAEATSGSELLNWAAEQLDTLRQGNLDTEGIKSMISELARFFNHN